MPSVSSRPTIANGYSQGLVDLGERDGQLRLPTIFIRPYGGFATLDQWVHDGGSVRPPTGFGEVVSRLAGLGLTAEDVLFVRASNSLAGLETMPVGFRPTPARW